MNSKVKIRFPKTLFLILFNRIIQFHSGFGICKMNEGSGPSMGSSEREASHIIFVDGMDMDIDHPWHDILPRGFDHPTCLFLWKPRLDRGDLLAFDTYISLSDF
jgi:hypothetical protein